DGAAVIIAFAVVLKHDAEEVLRAGSQACRRLGAGVEVQEVWRREGFGVGGPAVGVAGVAVVGGGDGGGEQFIVLEDAVVIVIDEEGDVVVDAGGLEFPYAGGIRREGGDPQPAPIAIGEADAAKIRDAGGDHIADADSRVGVGIVDLPVENGRYVGG